MNIVNVGYDSTNYYALDINHGKVLVDCGWPGTLPKLTAGLKRKGISPGEIRYLVVTHFYPDHAGIVQEIKDLGAKLILLESQPPFIAPMEEIFRRKELAYREIRPEGNLPLKFAGSRSFLETLGLDGEIISTPGHSDDSVTLLLDDGSAFTGDLPPRFMLDDEYTAARESWDRLEKHGLRRIYPAHGG
jgi:glyoxylase-like metal-dependent hydrolase (beta-lactamase superfamily II)